jgi:hypothetical protein
MGKRNRKGRVDAAEDPRLPPKNPAEDLTLPVPHFMDLDIVEGQERMIEGELSGEHRPMNPEGADETEEAAEEGVERPEPSPKEEL